MKIEINDYVQYKQSAIPNNIIIFQVKEINEITLSDGEDYYSIEMCKKLNYYQQKVMIRYNQ